MDAFGNLKKMDKRKKNIMFYTYQGIAGVYLEV